MFYANQYQIQIILFFRVTMELRAGEATVEKLKSRFEVLAKGDGEVLR